MTRLGSTGLRRVHVRTTATAMIGVVAILLVAGVGLVGLFEREQLRELDDQLDSRLEFAVDFIDRAQAEGTPLQGEAGPDDLVQVVDADGAIIYASEPLVGLPPLVTPDDLGGRDQLLRTVDAGDAGSVRTITSHFTGEQVLIFGSSTRGIDDAVESLTRSLLVGLPLLAIGLAVIVWIVVGRTLRPVDEAMRRERRLIADAGHDLRSPLAGVRALLETEPTDPAELEQNRVDALATLARLETIAEDLLVLARADGASTPGIRTRLVDLDEVVLRQVRLGRDAEVQIDTTGVSAGQVLGDESDLERLVENLLTNAVRHARDRVAVSLQEVGGEVELTVGDDGPGIPVEDRERVFERFTRLDESRTAGDGGAGLGLAIVRAVGDAHAGTTTIGTSPLGGAEVRVVLPASLAPSHP